MQSRTNEEIIKSHASDWVRWHPVCQEQVLKAMNDARNDAVNEFKNDAVNQ